MVELETIDIEIRLLLEGIFIRYGADFRDYSPASVRRRVVLAMEKGGIPSVSQLQERVLARPEAFDSLLQFLLVPTSEMFRDPSYFRTIRETVVPLLKTYPSLKIWVAGCSNGEELYSLAILLREEGLLEKTILYATDINPKALERAKNGIYPIDLAPKFTDNYQKAGGRAAFSDYYRAGYGSIILDASLRTNVVFADHSLATDNVFAEIQFISCRNVLIYFNRKLQDRSFRLFADSLGFRGFLGIGSKETLRFSNVYPEFEEFAAVERIYRKRRAV
ncbi:MAG: protein-glutamate O-methyltransferase CheR [Bdellovibrionales bacterium]|nr:protein-glutamate O-methyltransferase CheR [Bdellovibrionales bacterium]